MSEQRRCMVDGEPVGPRAKDLLCPKCASAWCSYGRYKAKTGQECGPVDEWAKGRRDGLREAGGRPKKEKGARQPRAPRPARPVKPVAKLPSGASPVEEKLLDHYLTSTDWCAIGLPQKREIVGRLLEVNP